MEDESTGAELAEVALAEPKLHLRSIEQLYEAGNLAEVDQLMRTIEPRDFPLKHRFTKTIVNNESRGMYVREIFMPAGSLILSKIHKTQHPFTILQGCAIVWTPGKPAELLQAGHLGITEPGTVRLLEIVEDCRWATFHPTDETDLEKIEDEVIAKPGEFIPLAPVDVVALEGSN
jgi:quercetin dioxygenase-like cupin family protein